MRRAPRRQVAQRRPRREFDDNRAALFAACWNECCYGGDGIADLYASLLLSRLATLEPDMADEIGIPTEPHDVRVGRPSSRPPRFERTKKILTATRSR